MLEKKWKALKEIWMEANRRPEGLRLALEGEKESRRLRQELYAAGRRSRRKRTYDEELLKVVSEMSITFTHPFGIHIYHQSLPPVIKQAQETLTDSQSRDSFTRLQELLDGVREDKPAKIKPTIDKGLTYRNPYLLNGD